MGVRGTMARRNHYVGTVENLKESNPVKVAEYDVATKLAEEPAFAWWIRKVLRRRDQIIKKVKSRYWSRTHKYGIELPHSVEAALPIDRRTGLHRLLATRTRERNEERDARV